MFSNIGGKIKTLAEIVCWIGIILSIAIGLLVGFTTFIRGDEMGILLWGLVVPLGGSLLSWISSFILYGFGQLIENSDILVAQSKKETDK